MENKVLAAATISPEKISAAIHFTDEKLLNLCEEFGKRALYWRRKFTGLLPEVARRKLYERKGFTSIFELAFKLAGLSEKQVRMALNLESRFGDKPALKSLLESGEVSVNKLARVASIATTENEEELAEKVKILPQKTLETLVRDVRISDKSLRAQTQSRIILPNFQLSDEVTEKINNLQLQGHDINQIILQMLEKRQQEIEQKKEELAQEAIARNEAKKTKLKPGEKLKTSQYMSVKVKAIIKEEHGAKCSIPGCHKPAKGNHHAQRLSLVGIHDPRYIAPMCKEHHQIAHLIDLKYASKSSKLR